ncbi:MAG: formyltetrahydrofolate deformylase [Homoserinimonas sp.]
MNAHDTLRIVLTLECENRVGIVFAVAGFLAEYGCDIVDSQQFDDSRGNRFFMRVEAVSPGNHEVEYLKAQFDPVAASFGMKWHLGEKRHKLRTLIMVSHADHCLNELIELWQSQLLNIEIVAVVSNHDTLRNVAERSGVDFHHIPVTPQSKSQAESALVSLIQETGAELVVLARYMQILSTDLCATLKGKVINIHHSFLPGFKGARPYHQAFDRGVKVIGATAHYVTADLDEGPIIDQSVFHVDHRAGPQDLAVAGRRAERTALAQAVAWHADRRIFVNGLRTVIFD